MLSGFLDLTQAWAASSAAAGEHAPSVTQLIFPAINFVIFLYLLKRYLVPPIKGYLRSRREEILNSVREAAEEKTHAEAMLGDYRKRVANLEEETKKILEEARSEGEREKGKLLSEARELAAKIKADADFLSRQELKVAEQRMREEIARLAQAAAQKLVRSHLTAADQKRLVEEFLSRVEQTI